MPTAKKPYLPKADPAANRTVINGDAARAALGASEQRWRHLLHNGLIDHDVFGRVALGDLVDTAVRMAVEHEAARHTRPGRPSDALRDQLHAAQIQRQTAGAELDKTRTAQANLDLLESRGLVLAAAGVESGVAFVMHVVAGLLRRLPRELARRVPGGAPARAAFIKAATARLTSLMDEAADRLARVAAPDATTALPLPPPPPATPTDRWTAEWSVLVAHLRLRGRAARPDARPFAAVVGPRAPALTTTRREQRAATARRGKKRRTKKKHAGRRTAARR